MDNSTPNQNNNTYEKFFSLNANYCVAPDAKPEELLNDASCFLEMITSQLRARLHPELERWDAELQAIIYMAEMSRRSICAAQVKSGLT